MKALATEARSSAADISELISNLQKKSEVAEMAVNKAETAVNQGNVALLDTLHIFARLAEAVDEISSHMEQVAGMSEQQKVSISDISTSAERVSGLIDETARNAVESATLTGKTADELTYEQVASMIAEVRESSKNIEQVRGD